MDNANNTITPPSDTTLAVISGAEEQLTPSHLFEAEPINDLPDGDTNQIDVSTQTPPVKPMFQFTSQTTTTTTHPNQQPPSVTPPSLEDSNKDGQKLRREEYTQKDIGFLRDMHDKCTTMLENIPTDQPHGDHSDINELFRTFFTSIGQIAEKIKRDDSNDDSIRKKYDKQLCLRSLGHLYSILDIDHNIQINFNKHRTEISDDLRVLQHNINIVLSSNPDKQGNNSQTDSTVQKTTFDELKLIPILSNFYYDKLVIKQVMEEIEFFKDLKLVGKDSFYIAARIMVKIGELLHENHLSNSYGVLNVFQKITDFRDNCLHQHLQLLEHFEVRPGDITTSDNGDKNALTINTNLKNISRSLQDLLPPSSDQPTITTEISHTSTSNLPTPNTTQSLFFSRVTVFFDNLKPVINRISEHLDGVNEPQALYDIFEKSGKVSDKQSGEKSPEYKSRSLKHKLDKYIRDCHANLEPRPVIAESQAEKYTKLMNSEKNRSFLPQGYPSELNSDNIDELMATLQQQDNANKQKKSQDNANKQEKKQPQQQQDNVTKLLNAILQEHQYIKNITNQFQDDPIAVKSKNYIFQHVATVIGQLERDLAPFHKDMTHRTTCMGDAFVEAKKQRTILAHNPLVVANQAELESKWQSVILPAHQDYCAVLRIRFLQETKDDDVAKQIDIFDSIGDAFWRLCHFMEAAESFQRALNLIPDSNRTKIGAEQEICHLNHQQLGLTVKIVFCQLLVNNFNSCSDFVDEMKPLLNERFRMNLKEYDHNNDNKACDAFALLICCLGRYFYLKEAHVEAKEFFLWAQKFQSDNNLISNLDHFIDHVSFIINPQHTIRFQSVAEIADAYPNNPMQEFNYICLLARMKMTTQSINTELNRLEDILTSKKGSLIEAWGDWHFILPLHVLSLKVKNYTKIWSNDNWDEVKGLIEDGIELIKMFDQKDSVFSARVSNLLIGLSLYLSEKLNIHFDNYGEILEYSEQLFDKAIAYNSNWCYLEQRFRFNLALRYLEKAFHVFRLPKGYHAEETFTYQTQWVYPEEIVFLFRRICQDKNSQAYIDLQKAVNLFEMFHLTEKSKPTFDQLPIEIRDEFFKKAGLVREVWADIMGFSALNLILSTRKLGRTSSFFISLCISIIFVSYHNK